MATRDWRPASVPFRGSGKALKGGVFDARAAFGRSAAVRKAWVTRKRSRKISAAEAGIKAFVAGMNARRGRKRV